MGTGLSLCIAVVLSLHAATGLRYEIFTLRNLQAYSTFIYTSYSGDYIRKNGVPGEQISLFLLNSFLRSGSYSMIKVKDYKNDVERITNVGVMIMKHQGICLGLRKSVKIDCHGVYYHESKDITV
jgi:hypothetical protein